MTGYELIAYILGAYILGVIIGMAITMGVFCLDAAGWI